MSLYTVHVIHIADRINDPFWSKGGGPMDERGDAQAMGVDFQTALDIMGEPCVGETPRRRQVSRRSTDRRETAVS